MYQDRDIYLFVFPTMKQADYWLRETIKKFNSEIFSKDYRSRRLTFPEADWYFQSEETAKKFRIQETFRFGPEELYIILDDPERKRLDTYEKGDSIC